MMNTWKTYNGIAIGVDDSGEFWAEVDSVVLRDRFWEGLRLQIEQEKKTTAHALKIELPCIALLGDQDGDGDYSVQRLTLVGLNRNDSAFKFAEKIDKRQIIYVLPHAPKNEALLRELAIAKSTVRDIEVAIKDRTVYQDRWGGRIQPTAYNEELSNLKDRYERSLEASKEPRKSA